MNRRSFLGFACGGVVAAPAAVLMGENAVDYVHGVGAIRALKPRIGLTGEVGPELTISVTGEGGDQHIQNAVRSAVDVALRQAEDMRRRGHVMRG